MSGSDMVAVGVGLCRRWCLRGFVEPAYPFGGEFAEAFRVGDECLGTGSGDHDDGASGGVSDELDDVGVFAGVGDGHGIAVLSGDSGGVADLSDFRFVAHGVTFSLTGVFEACIFVATCGSDRLRAGCAVIGSLAQRVSTFRRGCRRFSSR